MFDAAVFTGQAAQPARARAVQSLVLRSMKGHLHSHQPRDIIAEDARILRVPARRLGMAIVGAGDARLFKRWLKLHRSRKTLPASNPRLLLAAGQWSRSAAGIGGGFRDSGFKLSASLVHSQKRGCFERPQLEEKGVPRRNRRRGTLNR
jgi:hypothetical protein